MSGEAAGTWRGRDNTHFAGAGVSPAAGRVFCDGGMLRPDRSRPGNEWPRLGSTPGRPRTTS